MADDFQLALHTWTIDTASLDMALKAARRAGFAAIELRRTDFVRCFQNGATREQVIGRIRTSGTKVGVLGTEYGWFFAKGQEQRRLFEVLRETCETAVQLDCPTIMSAPGQLVGTLADAIAATRIADDIVGEHGLRLALEFNSQHDLVNSTAVLREIVAEGGHGHCGMLLDSYHLFRSGGIASGLRGVRSEEIFAFQYSDVPPNPVPGVRRPIDRLPPGDGVLDWTELFGLLRDIGYRGYLSYEAPNPVLWSRSPYDVAAEGYRKTKVLLDSTCGTSM